jgi:uncharacterized protein YjbJ (UPF0337 family)
VPTIFDFFGLHLLKGCYGCDRSSRVKRNLKRDFIKRGSIVKTSTEDQVEGKLRKAKGEIKETAGDLSNNPDLETEGSVEKAEGKVQEKKGQIKKVLGK